MRNLQKTLLALTLATLGATASAEVVLYGQIRGAVEVSQYKVDGESDGTTTAVQDLGSRIGFRGQEQLDNGLKAIWQLEQKVDIAGTSGRGFGTRDSFIGLSSEKLGTIRAGYFDSPVSLYNGEVTDEWLYSNDALGLGMHTRSTDVSQRRIAVDYTTPSFAGFSATAYVSPSDDNTGRTAGRDSSVYGLGLKYEQGAYQGILTGGYVKNGAANVNNSKDAYQANAQFGYDNGSLNAGLSYQYAKNVDTGYSRFQDVAATVGYKVTPKVKVQASAAYGFDIKSINKNKAWGNGQYYQGIVGAKYFFSKRTEAFGQVGYLTAGKNTAKQEIVAGSVGLRHKF